MKTIIAALFGLSAMLFACGGGAQEEKENAAVATAADVQQTTDAAAANGQEGSSHKDCRLVLYTANNCEPCTVMKEKWEKWVPRFQAQFPDMKFEEMNCEAPENMAFCDNHPMLGGYPAILLHYPDGKEVEYASRFEGAFILRFLEVQFPE